MKFKENNFTYNDHLQHAWYNKEVIDEMDVYSFLNKFTQLSSLTHLTLPALFILDYTKRSYLLVSDGIRDISNYDPREMLEGGLEKFLDIYHKEDFKVYNKNIFTTNIDFLAQTPQSEHHHYIFSNSYRIRNKDRSMSSVLQKSSFITSKETGMPLYAFGTVTDITRITKDKNYLHHFIEKTEVDKNTHQNKKLIMNKYYSVNESDTLLTKQEKIVLCYVSEGLSTKMIAEKLKISPNTVDNHRQNILKKTNCANTAQLIVFAVNNKLI